MEKKEIQGEPFKRITVEQAREMMKNGPVQIIDVREPKEVTTGYIEGSVLIPVNDVLGRAKELSTEASLLFVCAEGARSALACEMAAAVGRREVFNLEGGMKEWVRRGYPVVIH